MCRQSSFWFFFFQAEDGIRDLVRSRGLGDVYKRQRYDITGPFHDDHITKIQVFGIDEIFIVQGYWRYSCLLYTSDAADDLLCVDLGGRRLIKKKKKQKQKKQK